MFSLNSQIQQLEYEKLFVFFGGWWGGIGTLSLQPTNLALHNNWKYGENH